MFRDRDTVSSMSGLWDHKDEKDPYGVLDVTYKDLVSGRTHDPRIHVLGPGAVGLFIAHQLSGLNEPPPITLLLHKADLQERWQELDRKLTLIRDGITEVRDNIDVELIPDLQQEAAQGVQKERIIHQLIVTVKAHHLSRALERVKPFLRPDSTIVFLQNGLGIIEEVNRKLFPDESTRPRYIVGSVSHGLYKNGEFSVTHRAIGAMTLSVQPTMPVEEWERPLPEQPDNTDIAAWPASSRHLMRSLTRAPMLRAAGVAPHAALPVVLRKLAGNAVINPLTALFGCKNGELLNNAAATRLINMILAEVSLVLRSIPEAQLVPTANELFSAQALYYYVNSLCKITAENESSMLQDIQAGRQTEIDYINGWVVRRGEEMGIRCIVNFTMEQMVKAKSIVSWNQKEGLLPLEMPRAHGMLESEEAAAESEELMPSGREDGGSNRHR